MSVKPKEGWKRRVYRLEILPGIMDLRRNRSDSAKTVLFSTGPEIGHARIGGIALKWIDQTVLLRALIEAVPLPDSVGYLTMADSGGQFNLTNLQPGRYIVYATADENNDRRHGLREAYDSVEVTLDSNFLKSWVALGVKSMERGEMEMAFILWTANASESLRKFGSLEPQSQ